MYRYTWLLWLTTTLLCIQQFHQWWNPDTTLCIPKTGYGGQNLSLPPKSIPQSKDYTFSWYEDSLNSVNMLCFYNEKYEQVYNKLHITRQCLGNHTLLLINLTTHHSGIYYFECFYTFNTKVWKPNVCYNVTVHPTHQTYIHTTTLFHLPISTRNSLTISSFTSTNFTHAAVHHAASNVEAQHDTATPHTMWIIPLVVIVIIVLICFKFPQKAWNKFTQYRYSGMLAAA
ncbi:membrane glycoprotein UL9 [Human betaherpesvirus 5]|uniref:Membrane glycoprotein UL9 n=1 Tax=Human cytomegalovirus TaxID=10359 RepID=A0A0G2TAL4_HCMV|nr:membrane glycoprotein UL9 [Human betaherpesvirus 5]AMJ54882.1 membrane glycoprotein UL9 [Human betaherpesvirus 5]ARX80232.1 membrane glycoprotein UL9 [Human betaherpesvirus 5]